MIGKNLESACKGYAATKARRYQNRANELAGDAFRFATGSLEWNDAVAKFAALVVLAKSEGVELVK